MEKNFDVRITARDRLNDCDPFDQQPPCKGDNATTARDWIDYTNNDERIVFFSDLPGDANLPDWINSWPV